VSHGSNARDDGSNGEPSVSSSLEHLVAGSQGVITKRIDLALLEGQDLLSRSVDRVALVGVGLVLATVAWFAAAAALVLFAVPDASPVIRLAAFGLLNGAAAVGLVMLGTRHSRPPTRVRPKGNGPRGQRELLPAEGKN
jgi:hypothetical protein